MSNYGFYAVMIIAFLKRESPIQAKNCVLWAPVFQAVGALLYFSLKNEPDVFFISVLVVVGIALVVSIAANDRLVPFSILILVIVGFVCSYVKAAVFSVHDPVITSKTYLKNIVGTLSELNNYKHKHVQLLFCGIEGLKKGKACVRFAVRTAIDPMIKVGDWVKFSGVAYPPEASTSNNGHDFARIAYFKGINATGFATSDVVLHKRGYQLGFWHIVEKTRIKIYERFFSGLSKDTTEILSALIIGKRLGIRDEILENVRNSGLAHLLAISGLHLSFVAGMTFVFFRYVFACSEKLTLSYNVKKLCAVIAMITSFCYLLLTGVPISACRAFIMVAMMFSGTIVDRRHDSIRSLSAAASIILFYSPESVLSPSFQMSFVAVIALVSFGNVFCVFANTSSITKYVLATATSSFVASIATAPFVLYHFRSFSMAGVFANVIAVPLVTFVIIPLAVMYQIVCTTTVSSGIAHLLEKSVGFLLQVAEYTASSEWSILHFRAISVGSVIIITAGFLVICIGRGRFRLVYGLLLVISGTLDAFVNRTPDIICDGDVVAVKEADSKLYLALRTGSTRKQRYSQWARDNGQKKIHVQNEIAVNKRKLFCSEDGCIYDGRVLITCNENFLIQHCKEVDVIVYNGNKKYPDKCVYTKHIVLDDFKTYGVHYIKLRGNSILIDRAITSRPWHKNSQVYRTRNPKTGTCFVSR